MSFLFVSFQNYIHIYVYIYYLKGRFTDMRREHERERERPFIYLFTLQIARMARANPGQNQDSVALPGGLARIWIRDGVVGTQTGTHLRH